MFQVSKLVCSFAALSGLTKTVIKKIITTDKEKNDEIVDVISRCGKKQKWIANSTDCSAQVKKVLEDLSTGVQPIVKSTVLRSSMFNV